MHMKQHVFKHMNHDSVSCNDVHGKGYTSHDSASLSLLCIMQFMQEILSV